MDKGLLWSKRRKLEITVAIPLILVALNSATGVYSFKVYVALQEYFTKTSSYNIPLPEGLFFSYGNYLKMIIAYVIISLFVGIIISYLVNKLLKQSLEK